MPPLGHVARELCGATRASAPRAARHRTPLPRDTSALAVARSTHNANESTGLGLDASFRRLWTFYLCYCEAGFIEGRVSDVQVLLANRAPSASRSVIAWKEMRRAKVRFGLLIAAIGLLVFLILFQQSLQNGLITSFVGAIEHQSAPVLVYSVDGRRTLQGSVITPELEAAGPRASTASGRAGRIGQGTFTVERGRRDQGRGAHRLRAPTALGVAATPRRRAAARPPRRGRRQRRPTRRTASTSATS